MSGEMELEPVPQALPETETDKVIIIEKDGVEIVILPGDGHVKYISEDGISLDGDPGDGGKGLPDDSVAESIDMLGNPGDDKKGLG